MNIEQVKKQNDNKLTEVSLKIIKEIPNTNDFKKAIYIIMALFLGALALILFFIGVLLSLLININIMVVICTLIMCGGVHIAFSAKNKLFKKYNELKELMK